MGRNSFCYFFFEILESMAKLLEEPLSKLKSWRPSRGLDWNEWRWSKMCNCKEFDSLCIGFQSRFCNFFSSSCMWELWVSDYTWCWPDSMFHVKEPFSLLTPQLSLEWNLWPGAVLIIVFLTSCFFLFHFKHFFKRLSAYVNLWVRFHMALTTLYIFLN